MFVSTSALRVASRRAASASVRRMASTTSAKQASSNEQFRARALPVLAAAGLAIGASQLGKEEDKSQCLFGRQSTKVEEAVKSTEDKFANYWPRNIMILFGPPVSSSCLDCALLW
eukprot:CAMPEP_0113537064 /NCGR_PEP_ID=MMETSP0015_2-20120614/6619_1 /TAXON_ID=2838 /ORGANISM="Odontella" /LENGTH=114 /DNA_ID=CAMNT_0000436519 /DNA_START=59 /DNA_END=400 /DNA_ORIENTATION=+ /assembly_acc=CAM_ASM_000160